MKKKKNPVVIAIIVLLIILIGIIYLYVSPESKSNTSKSTSSSETTEKVSEVQVSTQTIENTLSSSGQISSALDEKLYLYASYYFQELLVENNVYIKEGENIVEYTNGKYLTAPYDCVVISSNLPEEDEICTSSHYVEISSIDTLQMTLNVSESEINKVDIGDEVNITITATNEKLTGYITSILEVGTYSSSGSYFTAVVEFENSGNLKIGMSATCEIVVEKAENVIAVPIEAIQTSDEGDYVIVVNNDGSTSNVSVETGIQNDAYIEIKSGLTGNETIQMQKTTSDNSSNNFMKSDRSSQGGGEMPSFEGGGQMPQMPGGMQN